MRLKNGSYEKQDKKRDLKERDISSTPDREFEIMIIRYSLDASKEGKTSVRPST